MKKIILILLAIVAAYGLFCVCVPLKRIDLPKGDLKWTMIRPKNAKFCVAAAFTSKVSKKVLGVYRKDGKCYGRSNKLRVSIKGNSFDVSRSWTSNNGFYQLSLVHNNKVTKFKDKRHFVRRALCKDRNGKMFLLESRYPMTLSKFAKKCWKYSVEAVYLDMGSYGFGYYKWHSIPIPLALWALYGVNQQSNWLYIQ